MRDTLPAGAKNKYPLALKRPESAQISYFLCKTPQTSGACAFAAFTKLVVIAMNRSLAIVLPVNSEVLHAMRDDLENCLGWCGKAAGCISIIPFLRVRDVYVLLRYMQICIQRFADMQSLSCKMVVINTCDEAGVTDGKMFNKNSHSLWCEQMSSPIVNQQSVMQLYRQVSAQLHTDAEQAQHIAQAPPEIWQQMSQFHPAAARRSLDLNRHDA